ncbi:hypothetical protein MVEN_01735500 [Mycena venus]|uniref:Bacteriophage T5 Orf172 DNA-binding domain-containing protein n=1 Tax=Mycena venus TaxID=2733690 RepID=A0A8H6XL66_9AGAR|nr:hypothetical protein MVEN_01735500 [Mycena venus]
MTTSESIESIASRGYVIRIELNGEVGEQMQTVGRGIGDVRQVVVDGGIGSGWEEARLAGAYFRRLVPIAHPAPISCPTALHWAPFGLPGVWPGAKPEKHVPNTSPATQPQAPLSCSELPLSFPPKPGVRFKSVHWVCTLASQLGSMTRWRCSRVAPDFDKHIPLSPFAALRKLRNPYKDGPGYIYIVRRVRREVYEEYRSKKISPTDYHAASQVQVGHAKNFETRQRAYAKCGVDWILVWEMKLSTPHRMLLEGLIHESLCQWGATVPHVRCSCSKRHHEFFDLEKAGGVWGSGMYSPTMDASDRTNEHNEDSSAKKL